MKIYTGGTFDLFHSGHVNFLARCADFGEVIVGLNTDDFIEEYKGKPPVMNYEERELVLLSCRYVKQVVCNYGGADSKPVIEKVEPNIIAIGDDWAKKDYHKQMDFTEGWLASMGIELIYLPYTHGVSSTEIKKRI